MTTAEKRVGNMIFEVNPKESTIEKAAPLFDGWQETLIWSCLQGVMGKIYVDSPESPASAMALLGDFCFFAGRPNRELVLYGPEQGKKDFLIMAFRDDCWQELIRDCYGEKAKETVRYAIKKEQDIFDREKLETVVSGLPEGYTLKMVNEELFWQCRESNWCRDLVSQYDNYTMYHEIGLGAVILKDGEPVSGASSYSSYIGGIEIEIDTREDHRRKGLAYICGAKLILECLKRGWYPSWDAQNKWSVALAEKLGYHFDHEYRVFEVTSQPRIFPIPH